MPAENLLIVGGAGNTGLPLARSLLAETSVSLTLAGRDLDRVQAAAAGLNQAFEGGRVNAIRLDVRQPEQAARAFRATDLVVMAAGTTDAAPQIAAAALDAGIDYFDVQLSGAKTGALLELAGPVAAAGLCFVTDGGFHPGLPAAMVRWAAPRFDRLESAIVGSVIQMDWRRLRFSDNTIDEFAAEIADFQPHRFRGGKWEAVGLLPQRMDFGPPFGRRNVSAMFLEELRQLPIVYPNLREAGFYVGGFNAFVDWLVLPLVFAGVKLRGRSSPAVHRLGRLLLWGLVRFSRPPFGTVLRLEAAGIRDGSPLRLVMQASHPDGYALTAIPAAACILQMLSPQSRRPGVWLQAQFVEPLRFFTDLGRLGVQIDVEEFPPR